MKTKEKKETLSYEMVDAKPKNFDFGECVEDAWEIGMGRTEEEIDNGELEPMMNYAYPLPETFQIPGDVRDKLNNTTIVLIRSDVTGEGEPWLALTGGGMDMSWEICESYINLGFYPPAHFSDLPSMAGRGSSARDRRIVKSCIESLVCIRDRAVDAVGRMTEKYAARPI